MKLPNSPFKHVVVMMFENRSFDSMLGFLYKDNKNVSPLTNQPFEGLTGHESNPYGKDQYVKVYEIDKNDPCAYFMPKKDPGEGFANTNFQLFGTHSGTSSPKGVENNKGFVRDFAAPIDNSPLEHKEDPNMKKYNHTSSDDKAYHDYTSDAYKEWHKTSPPSDSGHASYVPDLKPVLPSDIMGMYSPETLPVLNSLASHYAVCDHWYCSAPTETLPNRAFTHMATSQGYLYDEIKSYSAKSIFMHMAENGNTWGIYGNNGKPYTVAFCQDIPETVNTEGKKVPGPLPKGCHVGSFEEFKKIVDTDELPDYTFLEPIWGHKGNSQHPNYNVAEGEQYMLDIYNALKQSKHWEDTLLVITYDEHGGCYDHITPPDNATPPPAPSKAFGFQFDRFGVRVPAVLISPWIQEGTVYRTKGDVPIDHTSILATLEELFGLAPLTDRDKAAPSILDVATLDKPRTDNPLEYIQAPKPATNIVIKDHPSQIQCMHAEALTETHNRITGEHKETPTFHTEADVNSYIDEMHRKYYSY